MKTSLCIIVILVGAIFISCLGGPKSMEPPIAKLNPMEVWNYYNDSTRRLKLFPGTSAKQPGNEPHGAMVTIMVNKIAMKSIKDMSPTFAEGSFISKENYMPDGNLAAITVMYKSKGYDTMNGDWYWAKYLPDGSLDMTPTGAGIEGETVKMLGKDGKGCIACHGKAADRDWVFTMAN